MLTNFQGTTRASPVGALLSMLGLGRVVSFWGRVGSLALKHHGTALTQLPSTTLTDRELEKNSAELSLQELDSKELSQKELSHKELSSATESLQGKSLRRTTTSQSFSGKSTLPTHSLLKETTSESLQGKSLPSRPQRAYSRKSLPVVGSKLLRQARRGQTSFSFSFHLRSFADRSRQQRRAYSRKSLQQLQRSGRIG